MTPEEYKEFPEEYKELVDIAYKALNEPRAPEVWVMSNEEFNWFRETLKNLSNEE